MQLSRRIDPVACGALALHAIAFWPTWVWYEARMTDGSDEPWGWLALVAAVFVAWRHRAADDSTCGTAMLWSACGLTLVYLVTFPFVLPLVRAIIAVSAVACTLTLVARATGVLPVIATLAVLSLPALASVQFYCGYPLRVATASLGTSLLNIGGIDVERLGTAMRWHGETVLVDEPCSGVRMLWVSALVVCLVWSESKLTRWRDFLCGLAAVIPVVLIGNGVRAAALFWIETHGFGGNHGLHTIVGAVTFAMTCGATLYVQTFVRLFGGALRRRGCVAAYAEGNALR